MIRISVLLAVLAGLAGCAQYREPQANCFDLVSRGSASIDCSFEPLAGPGTSDEAHE